MFTRSVDQYVRAKALWDASYDLSRADNLWGEPPVPFVTDAVELFREDGAGIVLDLPCGDGRNLADLAQGLSFVVGVDSSPNALRLARRALGGRGVENVVLLESDIAATGFADDQFDGIFCCDVLGHLANPLDALTELIRICKPGRCVIANVFAMGDSTRGPNMEMIGDEEYVFDGRFYFKFYERDDVLGLMAPLRATPVFLRLVRWSEPPHEGYREYEHEHESWLFALRKEA